MGMSASQARLLTLTSRLSDLELKAQQISNNKIRLAMDTEQVSKDYAAALDKEKLTILTGYNQANPVYSDLTYNNLTGPNSPLMTQYGVSNATGQILVSQSIADKFKNSASLEDFLRLNNTTLVRKASVSESDYNAAQTAFTTAETNYTTSKDTTRIAKQNLDTYGAQYVKGYQGTGVWQYQDGYQPPDTASIISRAADSVVAKAQNAISTSIQSTTTPVSQTATYINGIATQATFMSNFTTGPAMPVSTCKMALESYLPKIRDNLASLIGLSGADQAVLTTQKSYIDASIAKLYAPVSPIATAADFYSDVNLAGFNRFDQNAVRQACANVPMGSQTTYSTSLSASDMNAKLAEVSAAFGGLNADFTGGSLAQYVTNRQAGLNYAPVIAQQGLTSDILFRINSTLQGITKAEITNAFAGTTYTGSETGAPVIRSSGNGDPLAFKPGFESGIDSDGKNITTIYQGLLNTYNAAVLDESGKQTAYNTAKAVLEALSDVVTTDNTDYYTNLYNRMKQGYFTMTNEGNSLNSPNWLQNQMMQGNLFLERVDQDKKWNQISYTADTNIVETTDDKDMAKAEAKYQTDIASIQSKDKKFDVQLTKINTEHNAIQTEIDSVKKTIDKNIERSFKIFDA